MDHPFAGDLDGKGECAKCHAPYETPDERHNYGKVWRIVGDDVILRPYVQADYDREIAYAAQAPYAGPRW